MKGRIAGTALAAAMITALVAATPAAASPLSATIPASTSTASFATHFGHQNSDRTGATYAMKLVDAWGDGDSDTVKTMATGEVATTLLSFANPGGTAWVHTTSREITGITFSSFVNKIKGKALVLGVQDSLASGDHAAVIARFVDYNKKMTAVDYAVQLVAAWNGDNDALVAKLATDDVAATFKDNANLESDAWRYTCSRAINGIMFSSFVNTDLGKALVVGVDKSAIGGDDAAVIARFVDYKAPDRIGSKDHHGDAGHHGQRNGWR